MLTFLYCLDKNYNIQAYTSIISLLENIDEPIKILILHKEPDTFLESKFYKQIKDRKNLSEIQIFNFQKEKVEFPKLSNVHVSEATYYRIYISNYIQSNQDILIYLDPDVICIKDPAKELKKKINELKASDEIIGASTETYKESEDDKEFKRLGVVGDFENYYSTMSNEAEAQIVRELGKFLLDGSLYQGFKPVLWSTVEKTALADAEVEYMNHTSSTIYVPFKVKETKQKFLKDANIVIWTTTPWTIPANKALAFNNNIQYSVVEINGLNNFKDKKIVVAKNLIESITKDCEINEYKILETFKGSDLKGTICSHPFSEIDFNYDVPLLEAQFVNLEQGTGIVHCAPSHGPDDFNLCLKNNIPSLYTVDNAGLYTKEIPYFANTHIFKADKIVIEKLKELNRLLKDGKLSHSYPHSWRSKAPLIYRATPQWFISMQKNGLRSKAIKAVNETVFYPNKGKERLLSMIEGRPDWCVSRQRVWGVPLPIFINKKTKEPLRDQKIIDRIASIYEKQGSDCWFTDDPKLFLGDDYNPNDYEKLNDIVEVWFDSGSTHSFVLEKRNDLK